MLANHFLHKHCVAMALEPKQFAEAALKRMAAYDWPGNTRQLENEIKRVLASVRGKTIAADQLAIQHDPSAAPRPIATRSESSQSLYAAVEALERQMIQDALIASRRQQAESRPGSWTQPAGPVQEAKKTWPAGLEVRRARLK